MVGFHTMRLDCFFHVGGHLTLGLLLLGVAVVTVPLLRCCFPSQERWGAAAAGLGSLRLSSHCLDLACHLFALLSIVLLCSRVWILGRRCDHVEAVLRQLTAMVADGNKKSAASHYSEDDDEDDMDEIVAAIRKRIAKERNQKEAAVADLEMERRAAASSFDELMAKIAALQNERALMEREARDLHEIAELRHRHDREVVGHLRWIISLLRDQKDKEKTSKLDSEIDDNSHEI